MLQKLFKHSPIVVNFSDNLPKKALISADLYCTAIARSLKKCQRIVIDSKKHPCSGGNYFVGKQLVPQKELEDIYVKKERVVEKKSNLHAFLKRVGQNPDPARYTIFEALKSQKDGVIIGIVNAANAGRLIGLSSYSGQLEVDNIPLSSTCSCLFRPLLAPDKIHLNFIDYFDRYHQCKGFFEEDELIVSMSISLYRELEKNYVKSPYGSFEPKDVDIFEIDPLC